MSNMSYCRFQNTLGDLEDCRDAIDSAINGDEEDKLSRQEANALIRMQEVMIEILDTMGHEVSEGENVVYDVDELERQYPNLCDF